MPHPQPTTATIPASSQHLADTPAVCWNGRWWLATSSGSLPVHDPATASELDALANDLDAANHAVVQLSRSDWEEGLG